MASLTQTAILTRKIVRYGIYLIIFLIIGRIFLGILVSIVNTVFPPQAPAPTVQFGKLPQLPFPNKNDLPALSYTIQTPEGGLPNLATQAKVYYMPQARADLLGLDKTKQKTTALGFTSNLTKVTQTLYQFSNSTNTATLEINIVTGTFSLGFDLAKDPSPLSLEPPTAEIGAQESKSFLARANILPDDLTGPVTQEYLKVQNRQLVTAISLSDANLTKINLYRKDYDKIPSVTPSSSQSNVWFLMSGVQDQTKQVIGAQFYYYPVDETQLATYPLKTSSQAYKDLQAGKSYVANLGDNKDGKITIRRVYLGYYDAGLPTLFYQPVVVFEGDNGFVAYVPAVTSNYYSQ